ncbi:MAG: thioredoxin fold domain-containing protein [Beijerinckiaceae bacterium]
MLRMIRAALLTALLVALSPAMAAAAALELLFVERSGCPWCARFEREALPAYLASELQAEAPLRRASLDNGQPAGVALDEPIRFTPTFVVLRDGREVARIVGYTDNALFFGTIEKMISDANRKPGPKS